MKRIQLIIFLLSYFFPRFGLQAQDNRCVSVSQETQVLSNGVKSIFKCDIYYNKVMDKIVTNHYYPRKFVKMANRFGEMKLYFQESNSVTIEQNQSLSTTNELLYYFVNNRLSDLGLSKENFKLVSTNREARMIVTIWQAPLSLKVVNQIKIVYNGVLPIYAEYLRIDGTILKKIYYSQYEDYKSFTLPLRITEISFESKTDSTIRRSVFSNVHTSDYPDNEYFNFKIPDDAKITK